jgi:actin-related protein 2
LLWFETSTGIIEATCFHSQKGPPSSSFRIKTFATMTQGKTIVCDIGASSIKVGFAGSLTPERVIPSVIGVPRNHYSNGKVEKPLIGKDALKARDRKKIAFQYPMDETGAVQDWNCLESLVRYALGEIGVNECSKHKILITKPYIMKRADLKRLFDLFFIKFGFRAVTMHEQAALVLYTQGVETGIVVELGESMANIVPVYKGHAIPKLDKRMSIGGRSISMYLIKLLRLKGYHMDAREDLETGHHIKERSCYVAYEPRTEERLAEETTVLEDSVCLQDGTSISLGKERFGAAEALFQPKLWDSEKGGLADIIFDTIQEADIDCRVDLYQNIILSGGLSLLSGLRERLEHDLNQRYIKDVLDGDDSRSRNWKLEVHAPTTREYLVFEGAALFADLISNERKFWVTKAEYEVEGIQLLLDKCQVA